MFINYLKVFGFMIESTILTISYPNGVEFLIGWLGAFYKEWVLTTLITVKKIVNF